MNCIDSSSSPSLVSRTGESIRRELVAAVPVQYRMAASKLSKPVSGRSANVLLAKGTNHVHVAGNFAGCVFETELGWIACGGPRSEGRASHVRLSQQTRGARCARSCSLPSSRKSTGAVARRAIAGFCIRRAGWIFATSNSIFRSSHAVSARIVKHCRAIGYGTAEATASWPGSPARPAPRERWAARWPRIAFR